MNITNKLFSKDLAPNRWIEIMQYSPDGKYLAIGDHKQRLSLFKINDKGKYK